MKVLLDTHAFLWLEESLSLLSPYVRTLVASPDVTVYLSYLSIWEVQIKLSVGKLQGKSPLAQRVALAQSRNNLYPLPVKLEHIYLLNALPMHHRDPFDRLLIAQALYEGIPLISKDEKMKQYDVQCVW
jgi:PIN domain nuclease of toxin-antitoxin system